MQNKESVLNSLLILLAGVLLGFFYCSVQMAEYAERQEGQARKQAERAEQRGFSIGLEVGLEAGLHVGQNLAEGPGEPGSTNPPEPEGQEG